MKPQHMTQSKKVLWCSLLFVLGIALVSFTAWGAKPVPVDSDGDGIEDKSDICPFDFDNDTDGDGICGDVDPCPYDLSNDIDGDGVCIFDGDCNDNDPYQTGTEICGDGIDNDCDDEIDELCNTVDTDQDGYPDVVEAAGIQLVGFTMADGVTTFLPYCNDPNYPNYERAYCVDPNSPDLFVIMQRASSLDTNIPVPPYSVSNPDPLAFVAAPPEGRDTGGLGIATHELLRAGATDQGIAGHYAVRIVENLDPNASLFGLSTPGLPNPTSTATVWTEKIIAWIDETCAGATTTCIDDITGTTVLPGQSLIPLHDAMVNNIINHEIGHLISLAAGANVSAYHLPAAEGVVMEQFIGLKVVDRKGVVTKTLYISEDFADASRLGYRLK